METDADAKDQIEAAPVEKSQTADEEIKAEVQNETPVPAAVDDGKVENSTEVTANATAEADK